MRCAVIVGGARCWRDDLKELRRLYGRPWDGLWLAVNEAGIYLPRLDHWCTIHHQDDKIGAWKPARAALGHPPATVWGISTEHPDHLDEIHREWTGGSSGLYAVSVALHRLHCDRIVLAGMPMDRQANDFRREPRWAHHQRYWDAWTANKVELQDVLRSMSGLTRATFGAPTPEWLGAKERCTTTGGSVA
jgi:hypothetical protein